MDVVRLVIPAAIILVMAGSFLGVVLARVTWAQDLKQAQTIDAIRSKTEGHLREQISALERRIAVFKQRLGE